MRGRFTTRSTIWLTDRRSPASYKGGHNTLSAGECGDIKRGHNDLLAGEDHAREQTAASSSIAHQRDCLSSIRINSTYETSHENGLRPPLLANPRFPEKCYVAL